MNTALILSIMIVSAVALVVGGKGIARVRASRSPQPVDTPTLRLVKRRRELQAKLHQFVGCDMEAARIVREEAERLQKPRASIEALEAAIKRVEVEQAFNRG